MNKSSDKLFLELRNRSTTPSLWIPDATHIDQLAVVLRYMEKDVPMERFVIFMENKGLGAQRDVQCLDGIFEDT